MYSSQSGSSSSSDDTNYWNDQYQAELQHIDKLMDEGDTGAAYQYLGTTFLYTLQNFTECYDMGTQANIENACTQLNDRLNDIDAYYNDYYTSSSNSSSQVNGIDAHNALVEWSGGTLYGYDSNGKLEAVGTVSKQDSMQGLLQTDVSSGLISQDTADSVTAQMIGSGDGPTDNSGTVLQGYTTADSTNPGQGNDMALAKIWSTSWQQPSNTPVNPTDDSTSANSNTSSSLYESITSAFTTTGNYFSSQSQQAQSAESYYEGVDEQYMTMEKNTYSSLIDQEKTMVTNMQSS